MISKYLKTQRHINGTITGIMISLGLAMTGYGAYSIVMDVAFEPPQSLFINELSARCEMSLHEANLFPDRRAEGGFVVNGYTLDEPLMTLSLASVAIQLCEGYTLESFCMGEGCENPPLQFNLAPLELTL